MGEWQCGRRVENGMAESKGIKQYYMQYYPFSGSFPFKNERFKQNRKVWYIGNMDAWKERE